MSREKTILATSMLALVDQPLRVQRSAPKAYEYTPEQDGLRAIAVLMVNDLPHAGARMGWLSVNPASRSSSSFRDTLINGTGRYGRK